MGNEEGEGRQGWEGKEECSAQRIGSLRGKSWPGNGRKRGGKKGEKRKKKGRGRRGIAKKQKRARQLRKGGKDIERKGALCRK